MTKESHIIIWKQWLMIDGKLNMKLCYRYSTNESKTPKAFHKQCDYKPNTIVLVILADDSIIGGYTTVTWNGRGYKQDSKAFLFNLTKEKKYQIII